jgi:DNA-directed RNA polymerase specialized sigma24 family protein
VPCHTVDPALFRVPFALTGQRHAAEDLLQAALERVYVRWDRLSDPPGYAKRVMYHESVSWWRRLRHEVSVAVLPEVSDDDSAAQVLLRRAARGRWHGSHPPQRRC